MSDQPNDGGPAFPLASDGMFCKGMTLRDYFAGQAVQGIYAENGRAVACSSITARDCYDVADAMLRERGIERELPAHIVKKLRAAMFADAETATSLIEEVLEGVRYDEDYE